jgi:hypothetical protein
MSINAEGKIEVSAEWMKRIEETIPDKKIQTIKLIREATGLGLKEAKDFVDERLYTEAAVGGGWRNWFVVVTGTPAPDPNDRIRMLNDKINALGTENERLRAEVEFGRIRLQEMQTHMEIKVQEINRETDRLRKALKAAFDL